MKIKFIKDYVGNAKDSVVDLPEDQAKTLIDGKIGEAVVDEISGRLDVAVKKIRESLTKDFEAAAARHVADAIERINKIPASAASITINDRSKGDPTGGFKNLGDFALAIYKGATKRGDDERMTKYVAVQKADGMDESALADGGALVPVQYANELYRDVLAESIMFERARKYPINIGNSLFIPVRTMTTLGQTDSTGASLGTWLNADGVAITAKKPVYNRVQMVLNRWGTMLPVTDELLADNNVALSNFIFDEGGIALAWDLNQAFISGAGSALAQPQGILNSGALVTTPQDLNQPAGTISYTNLVNMKARMWTVRPGNNAGVVWIAHPDCEAQFEQLKDAAGRNLYFAAGTIQQSPQAKLFGIPVEYSYHCSAPGTLGDVILADLSQYLVSTKAQGAIQTAMSMHLYFDSAEMAYRIIYRIDGKTARQAPLIIPNSANPRSGFVALESRLGTVS